ncbi:MAG: RNA methyltransferase, partial [Streptococcaceae bacterium]|nr:RNA methyltransferase [Streptococcaceae bacterium]
MEIINSKENKKVKEARKLFQKKYRDKTGHYLIEGFHLLEEALASNAEIVTIFVAASKADRVSADRMVVVSDDVLKTLSDEETPQGVVAEVVKSLQSVDFSGNRYLVLENVQDPGNVGTLIRTADAAGFDTVICVGQTADIYSPKVLRSAQGSTFHLSIQTYSELP